MSKEPDELTPEATTEVAATDTSVVVRGADTGRRTGRPWRALLFLAALFALGAAVSGYFIFDLNNARKTERGRFQAMEDSVATMQRNIKSLREDTRRLDGRLAGKEERLTGILHTINDLRRRLNGGTDWRIVELKYLLLSASQHLALARDQDAAQAILQFADARIREIADPALAPVRASLSADINRLQATPRADFAGLALALGELVRHTDQLPLSPSEPVFASAEDADTATNHWRGLAGSLWQELKSLFVIARTDNYSVALLAPEERFFLYQNLRLQLAAARLALLARDAAQFRESINACTDWLNDFFDTDDERVRNAQAILENASSAKLRAPAPSIEATLRAFDEYLARQDDPVTKGGTGH